MCTWVRFCTLHSALVAWLFVHGLHMSSCRGFTLGFDL